MNSSALSSNHNLSSLNESSSSVVPCCSHQIQYQNLYQQLSNLRIHNRHLLQQCQVFKNTVQGLEEQNKLMKTFLNGKKQMVNKLTMESMLCNQQINRLEDQLHNLKKNESQLSEELQKMKQKLSVCEYQKEKQREKYIDLNKRFKMFEVQTNKDKNEKFANFQNLLKQKDLTIQSITKFLNSKIGSFQREFSKIKQGQVLQMKQKSTNEIGKLQKANIKRQIFENFEIKLNAILIESKLKQQNYQEQLQNKNKKIDFLNEKVMQLQNQINESMQLLEVNMKQMNGLKMMMKNKQIEKQQTTEMYMEKMKRKDDICQKIIKKLIEIIKNSFVNQNITAFDKLLELSSNSHSSSFEIQILINEIKSLSDVNHIESLKHSLQSKQLNRLNRENRELMERLQLLTLKLNTLEREYRQIIEDNNRLIKYNNLTQYRVNRNLNIMTQSINKSTVKQDIQKTPTVDKNSLRKTIDKFSNKQNIQFTSNR